MEPRLIERECGGWLAVTAPHDAPRIGVTAPSRSEAETAFAQSAQAWAVLLAEAHRRGDGVELTES